MAFTSNDKMLLREDGQAQSLLESFPTDVLTAMLGVAGLLPFVISDTDPGSSKLWIKPHATDPDANAAEYLIFDTGTWVPITPDLLMRFIVDNGGAVSSSGLVGKADQTALDQEITDRTAADAAEATARTAADAAEAAARTAAIAAEAAARAVDINGLLPLDGSRAMTGTLTGTIVSLSTYLGSPRIQALSNNPVSLPSNTPGLLVGSTVGQNIAASLNVIQARDNGAAEDLILNPLGGAVEVPLTPTQDAHVASKKYVDDAVSTTYTRQGVI